jgi:hypothetical protein
VVVVVWMCGPLSPASEEEAKGFPCRHTGSTEYTGPQKKLHALPSYYSTCRGLESSGSTDGLERGGEVATGMRPRRPASMENEGFLTD